MGQNQQPDGAEKVKKYSEEQQLLPRSTQNVRKWKPKTLLKNKQIPEKLSWSLLHFDQGLKKKKLCASHGNSGKHATAFPRGFKKMEPDIVNVPEFQEKRHLVVSSC